MSDSTQPGASVGLLTHDPTMLALLAELARAARTSAPVLIEGESGTGKELLARYVHAESQRRERPFIAVNCAAIPEALLESEMFGHERGAFTGAVARRVGRFEAAHGGTLLLDEISEMPPGLQAKLLRALQGGELQPLGMAGSITVDVRVVATTNRRLIEEIKAGRFREDLFYRLHVVAVRVPPLRDRPGDIGLLAEYLLDRYASAFGRPVRYLSALALRHLLAQPWPGNVRELENAVQRAVILCTGSTLSAEDLAGDPLQPVASSTTRPGRLPGVSSPSFREMERRFILQTVQRCGGNQTHAAELLGVSVRTVRNKLRAYRTEALDSDARMAG